MIYKSLLATTLLAGACLSSLPAAASIAPGAANQAAIGTAADDGSMQLSRRGRGADDGAGHQRRCRGCDDGANHASNPLPDWLNLARRGADDPAGDNRGGRGKDDPAGHAVKSSKLFDQMARRGRGKDDPVGHG